MRVGSRGTKPQHCGLIEQMRSSSVSALYQVLFCSQEEASRDLCPTLAAPFPFPAVYCSPSEAFMKVLARLLRAHSFQSPYLPRVITRVVGVRRFHAKHIHATLFDMLLSVCGLL